MKIKSILLVAMLLLVVSGCNKDTFFPEEDGVALKSAVLKNIPIKADMYAQVLEETDGLAYKGLLIGTVSHLGEMIAEKSTFTRTYYEYREGPSVYWEMYGDIAASNGDVMHYTLWGLLDVVKNEYVSTVTYDGGTGRFANVTGNLDLTGYIAHGTGRLYMQGEGMISNVGSTR
jgi:hypothetical protein